MKRVYTVVRNNKVIAIHKSEKVVRKYCKCYNGDYGIAIIKMNNIDFYDDITLIKFFGIYIQKKYLPVIENILSSYINIDILDSINNLLKMSDNIKNIKVLTKSYIIIEEEIQNIILNMDYDFLESEYELYMKFKQL